MLTFLLLLGAFICFGLAALNLTVKRVELTALGLALWVLTFLIPAWPG
jgi:hypothetical protein